MAMNFSISSRLLRFFLTFLAVVAVITLFYWQNLERDDRQSIIGYFSDLKSNPANFSERSSTIFLLDSSTRTIESDSSNSSIENAINSTDGYSSTNIVSEIDQSSSPSLSSYYSPSSTSRAIVEPVCKIPQLLVDDPIIKPHLRTYPPLVCPNESNWVFSRGDGRFYFDPDAMERHGGQFECNYSRIDRVSDRRYKEVFLGPLKNATVFKGSDAFHVVCYAEYDNTTYDNLHAAVPRPNMELHQRIEKSIERLKKRRLDLNVFVYMIDSVSRVNFIRQCPKFYELLTEGMGAYVMEGMNTVGDGTPWTLIPMTTGYFQYELPEARRRFDNASYLDTWPMIFSNYSDAGYVTSFVEEMVSAAAYVYKLRGFDRQPVDHYLRTFLLADNDRQSPTFSYCMGDTPRSIVWCQFWRELQAMYRPIDARHFSILFSAELSHDYYSTVQQLDEHWVDQFGRLHKDGLFNDTLLIVMGDHGRRFGPIRQTQSGKLEEKLPFLSLVLPEWFRRQFPKSHENLLRNRHRLMTPFDLYATFIDVLDAEEDGGLGDINERGISLLREIPAERTCAHAHIKPHFCSCLDWADVPEPQKDPIVRGAVQRVIDRFNGQTAEVPGRCAKLTIGRIVWARILKPKDSLMAFKESIDTDNYNPDLTGDKKLQTMTYQFRFVTEPGGGDFEASVSYYVESSKYGLSDEDISRLNSYNHQAQCVIHTHGHLRTFCYCL